MVLYKPIFITFIQYRDDIVLKQYCQQRNISTNFRYKETLLNWLYKSQKRHENMIFFKLLSNYYFQCFQIVGPKKIFLLQTEDELVHLLVLCFYHFLKEKKKRPKNDTRIFFVFFVTCLEQLFFCKLGYWVFFSSLLCKILYVFLSALTVADLLSPATIINIVFIYTIRNVLFVLYIFYFYYICVHFLYIYVHQLYVSLYSKLYFCMRVQVHH